MNLSDPARSAFCCFSLRTAIWTIIFFDVFSASSTLSRITVAYLQAQPAISFTFITLSLYSVICGLTILGATFGVLGLINSKATFLSSYASIMICRIAVSLFLTGYSLYKVDILVDETMRFTRDKIESEASRTHEAFPELSKSEMRHVTQGGIVGALVFLELTTDIILLYFAYIIQSLAEWVKRGHAHVQDGSDRESTVPLLHTSV